ncbi:hypothetical protein [Neotabrizicola sp. VNH66]|uniref:hypothetical protein n=1 Tax=Neotabrizicola sp. VNH66 TaxID=3400918 RepID=UPI003C10AA75
MRHAIIRSFDVLVWLMAALLAIGGLVAGGMAMGQGQGLAGLMIIVGGILYAIIFAGMLFLVVGIYENTKRTAEAVERMGGR